MLNMKKVKLVIDFIGYVYIIIIGIDSLGELMIHVTALVARQRVAKKRFFADVKKIIEGD